MSESSAGGFVKGSRGQARTLRLVSGGLQKKVRGEGRRAPIRHSEQLQNKLLNFLSPVTQNGQVLLKSPMRFSFFVSMC